MARIRSVKPEFWTDEDLSALPAETHIFAAGLLNQADDEGYFKAHPQLLQAAIFPIRKVSIPVETMLSQLATLKYITLFVGTDGKQYGKVVKFTEHQVINRPSKSKIRAKEPENEASVKTHGVLSEDSSGKGKEGKGKERKGSYSISAPPVDSDYKIKRIVLAYPKHAHLPENKIPQVLIDATMTAMEADIAEGMEPSQALEYMYDRVRAIGDIFRRENKVKWLPDYATKFMLLRQYREEDVYWMEKSPNAAPPQESAVKKWERLNREKEERKAAAIPAVTQ